MRKIMYDEFDATVSISTDFWLTYWQAAASFLPCVNFLWVIYRDTVLLPSGVHQHFQRHFPPRLLHDDVLRMLLSGVSHRTRPHFLKSFAIEGLSFFSSNQEHE